MQLSLKYILALTASLSMAPLHAEMMQSSSLNSDVDGPNANLAARVLSKDTQNFNSRFSNINSLSIFGSMTVRPRSNSLIIYIMVSYAWQLLIALTQVMMKMAQRSKFRYRHCHR